MQQGSSKLLVLKNDILWTEIRSESEVALLLHPTFNQFENGVIILCMSVMFLTEGDVMGTKELSEEG